MHDPSTEKFIDMESPELSHLALEAGDLVNQLLVQFNARQTKLFDLPAHQRIFLFILTRSIKTYSSIVLLCRHGYGQDVATLLRGLLENLITARYILHNPKNANHLAERFVAYKWIIFKRSLPEQEQDLKAAPKDKRDGFFKRKAAIMRHVEEFKQKFNVTSDRALLTWSGKTVRDMAKYVDARLLDEYDLTFRQCSKFSHPSILGDHEYLIQDNKNLVFSPLPSPLGVAVNLQQAVQYFLEFAKVVNELFGLKKNSELVALRSRYQSLTSLEKKPGSGAGHQPSIPTTPIRECTIVFKVRS